MIYIYIYVLGKTRSRGRGTWQDMTKAPFMWLICSSYLVVFMTRTAALDWAQLFLIEEAGQTEFTGKMSILMDRIFCEQRQLD